MKISLLLLFTLFSIECFAQTNIRLWETGPLTWDDFRGEPFSSSPNASELSYQLSYTPVKTREGDTTYHTFQTQNYINQNTSWVKESEKSSQLLRYNQVMFNILEIYRRQLQVELNKINNEYMAVNKFNTIFQNCKYEIRQFQSDTQYGTNEKSLAFWDQLISQRLEENPFDPIPEISDRNFGIGLNAGLGGGLLTGTLSEFFTPTINFIFGFDVAYKNTYLFVNGTLGRDKVRQEFTREELLWPDNLKSNVAVIDLSLGRTLYDNEKHRLTPFAGLGILEFSASQSEGDQFNDHRATNFGLLLGLNYDFKLRKNVRLIPSPYSLNFKERVVQNIRTKLYVTTADFGNFKGASVNLTVSYSFFSRLVSVN